MRRSEKIFLAILAWLIFVLFLTWMGALFLKHLRIAPITETGNESMHGNVFTETGDKYLHHGDVLLPNPMLSLGMARTIDVKEVCHERARDFRDTREGERAWAYDKYGVQPHQGICRDTTRMTKGTRRHPPHIVVEACELDHIIPLELGGADTEDNLFPQPYNPPNAAGAHAKDWVEDYLHDQVCHHGMSLPEAQKRISTDWYQVYLDASGP